MIKAQELRIGNFIKVSRFNVDIPARIETYDDLYQISMGELKASGEPLTEEWLIKLGFESNSHFTVMNSKFLNLGRNRQISIGCAGTPNEMIFLQEIEHKKVNDLICVRNFDYDGRTYVHQLQNIYHSLTGQELTIS